MFSVCIGSHLNTDHERSTKTKAQTKFQAQLVGWLEQQVSGRLTGMVAMMVDVITTTCPGTSGNHEVDCHVTPLKDDSG